MLHRRNTGTGRGARVLRTNERDLSVQRSPDDASDMRYAQTGAWI